MEGRRRAKASVSCPSWSSRVPLRSSSSGTTGWCPSERASRRPSTTSTTSWLHVRSRSVLRASALDLGLAGSPEPRVLVCRRSLEQVSAKSELLDLEIKQGKCHVTDLVWQMVFFFYLWSTMDTVCANPCIRCFTYVITWDSFDLMAFLLKKQEQRARSLPQSHGCKCHLCHSVASAAQPPVCSPHWRLCSRAFPILLHMLLKSTLFYISPPSRWAPYFLRLKKNF